LTFDRKTALSESRFPQKSAVLREKKEKFISFFLNFSPLLFFEVGCKRRWLGKKDKKPEELSFPKNSLLIP